MSYVFKMLQAFLCTLALCTLALAGIALTWPDVSLVRTLGCFDSYAAVETFLLLPIQGHPLAFAIGSFAALMAVLAPTTFSALQDSLHAPT